MSVRETLVRNTVWYGLVTVLGLVVGVVSSVVLARALGPARMGDYSYILWAGRAMMAVATLGFALAAVRYTAGALADGQPALASGFVVLLRRRQTIAAAVVVAVALPVILLTAPDTLRWALVVTAVALFPMTLEHLYCHAVYGAQRYEFTAQASTIKMLLQLAVTVALLALGFDLLGLIIGTTLVTLVSGAIHRARVWQLYPKQAARVPDTVRHELGGYLVPLSIVAVLDALVWDRSEIFFLRLSASPHDIAFYSLAFGLATKTMLLPEVTVGALLPAFSALHRSGTSQDFRALYQSALRYVALTAIPIAALGLVLAPPIVDVLYGHEYAAVAPIFSVLGIFAALSAMRRVAWSALRGLGDRRCAIAGTSIGAAANIAIAALLIPRLGIWGAVAANSTAQTIASIIGLTVMARVHRCGFPIGEVSRIVLAGVLAFGAATAVLGHDAGMVRVIAAALAGVGAYLAACVGLRVIGAREWRMLSSTARRFWAAPVLTKQGAVMGGLDGPPKPPALGAPRGTRGAPRPPDSLRNSEA